MIPFGFQIPFKQSGCEDAPPVYNERYSVVCDGLGGSGSRRHVGTVEEGSGVEERTSAYIGSRLVSDCVVSFLNHNYEAFQSAICSLSDGAESIPKILSRLKGAISTDLRRAMTDYRIPESALRSRTFKVFPTTLAAALYFPQGEDTIVLGLWAGDSRIYLMTPDKGLQLLSMDDSDIADEMGSVSEMNNCISADGNYRLNYIVYRVHDTQAMLFCCSDGCFDLLCSPIHFEWLLLYSLLNCNTETTKTTTGIMVAESIRDKIYKKPGDDTTMCGVLIGMKSTASLKSAFKSRFESFSPIARKMNKAYSDWKSSDGTQQRLDKELRLLAPEAEEELKRMIFNTLKRGKADPFYKMISKGSRMKSKKLFTTEESRLIHRKLNNLLIAADQLKDELRDLHPMLRDRVIELEQQLLDKTISEGMDNTIYAEIKNGLIENIARLKPKHKKRLPQSVRRYSELTVERKRESDKLLAAKAKVERLWEEYRINYQLYAKVTEKGEV